jgi:YVTN family beta-propeller protein
VTQGATQAPQKVPQSSNPYTLFETLQVRPLALSPDGARLYALNTPDNRLEVYDLQSGNLKLAGEVEVGLEPVAVAARTKNEIWVVNHLSDSVSIVDTSSEATPRVVNTLYLGDEPRDIVFAGTSFNLAFITTAHRGQNSPDDPDLFASGVGRADVWVFDANNLGTAAGGKRLTKLTFFADTPRALAATPDGKTVYAAAFLSGNQTTTVSSDAVLSVYNGTMPGPANINLGGPPIPQPSTGEVVKYKAGPDGVFHWFDAYGSIFDSYVNITLPDQDVFAIDATANPPAAVSANVFAHVGTTLFNMAVNPKSGKVYVSNLDAHNDVRFEGHTPGFTSVVGNLVDSRITVLDPTAKSVTSANLNSHLNHANNTGDPTLSMAFPEGIAVTQNGKNIYAVAQGSNKLAVYPTSAVEAGSVTPSAASQVHLSGGQPTGVVLNENEGMAFVLTRGDNGISQVNIGNLREVQHVQMFNPEPPSVTAGRQYLYDATQTSALGDQACASCHIGGDFDGLAWDLGNPGNIPLTIASTPKNESVVQTIPKEFLYGTFGQANIDGLFSVYMPVKGPMTTQSLRGLDNEGAMHWRGDRNGAFQQNGAPFLDGMGNPVVSAQPNAGIFDEFNAFKSFNVAFPGLVGNAAQISDADMTDFTNFVLQITYPPNPIHNLDNSLTPLQQGGAAFFFNHNTDGSEAPSDTFHNCNGCHVLDRNGNAGASAHPGFFGTDGRLSFEGLSQIFKVPHLRNAYQKIGMYASSPAPSRELAPFVPPLNGQPANGGTVPAVRGFGYLNDGAIGSVEQFITGVVFVQSTQQFQFGPVMLGPNPDGIPFFNDPTNPLNGQAGISTAGIQLRRAIAAYVLAFDSNMFPIVGQDVSLTTSNGSSAGPRIALLESQAAAGQCDLVARGFVQSRERGYVYSQGNFVQDTTTSPSLTDAQLQALVGSGTNALTFTCVPPGSGWRVGIDRDGDGYADGDELAARTNPADPTSHP